MWFDQNAWCWLRQVMNRFEQYAERVRFVVSERVSMVAALRLGCEQNHTRVAAHTQSLTNRSTITLCELENGIEGRLASDFNPVLVISDGHQISKGGLIHHGERCGEIMINPL